MAQSEIFSATLIGWPAGPATGIGGDHAIGNDSFSITFQYYWTKDNFILKSFSSSLPAPGNEFGGYTQATWKITLQKSDYTQIQIFTSEKLKTERNGTINLSEELSFTLNENAKNQKNLILVFDCDGYIDYGSWNYVPIGSGSFHASSFEIPAYYADGTKKPVGVNTRDSKTNNVANDNISNGIRYLDEKGTRLNTVNIHNGTSWVEYIPYIHNGTQWVEYIPYIHNGTSWVEY